MKDFILDEDRDLKIKDDDLLIGVSDEQHREHLLLLEKGALKQSLTTGVGLFKHLEAEDPANLFREIAVQFSADGMEVKKVGFNDVGQLLIQAPYKS
jgi:hypothetical protein